MKHTTLYNEDGTPKEGVDIKNLRKLSDALHNPSFELNFVFDMGDMDTCVMAVRDKLGIWSSMTSLFGGNGEMAEYLCSFGWADVDNTRNGAALRLDYILENGLPKDYEAQIDGEAPLSYRK